MGYIYFLFPSTIKLGRVAYNLTMYQLKPLSVKFYWIPSTIENFPIFLFRWEAEIVGVSRNFEVWHPSAEIVHARHMCEFIIKSSDNGKFQTFGGERVPYEIVSFITKYGGWGKNLRLEAYCLELLKILWSNFGNMLTLVYILCDSSFKDIGQFKSGLSISPIGFYKFIQSIVYV